MPLVPDFSPTSATPSCKPHLPASEVSSVTTTITVTTTTAATSDFPLLLSHSTALIKHSLHATHKRDKPANTALQPHPRQSRKNACLEMCGPVVVLRRDAADPRATLSCPWVLRRSAPWQRSSVSLARRPQRFQNMNSRCLCSQGIYEEQKCQALSTQTVKECFSSA